MAEVPLRPDSSLPTLQTKSAGHEHGNNPNREEVSTEPRQDHPSQESKNRTGLPDKLKGGIEAISGLSLDDVRVHYHSSEPSRLHALAYTRGSEIHVAPGQESQLPHEAWHVVQQSLEKFLSTGIPYTYGRVGSQNIG